MERTLQALVGNRAAAVCCSTTDGDPATLTPDEYAAVSAAIAHRQREFAAGRSAARLAMHRLGRPGAALPADPDRSPRWPQGLVGSISHSRTTCIAIVALREHCRSVGVDVEPDRDLPRELWDLICRPDELQRVSDLPEAERARWVTRVFCAKEAYYKWVYPQIHALLDFQDVAIEMALTLDDTRFVAHPLQQDARERTPLGLAGTITATQDMVISLVIH
ncbi:4'-phosphopantetheinyl transferase family protein [Hydrogenophaga sp. RWCD_12]|uniref:4'-phosphopantetheinyl transferase family protein n=1 Tax=Hydrogenophaga sp. RWCD_12 TaxID=3391190 RepID=UPI003984CFE1